MIKGSEKRHAEHPVDPLFLDRWSPRAMSGAEIPQAELMSLFEAARWAPSSYNEQPWRLLYARRGTPQWPLFFDLLVDVNKSWCQHAAALVLFTSRTTMSRNGKPSITHSFDTGAAWQSFALQGWLKGYVVHGMQGFDYARAKTALGIPDDVRVEAIAAVGLPGDPAQLMEALREREVPNERKPLSETVCEGRFAF